MAVITELSEPSDGRLAQRGQMIKRGQEASAPTVVEKGKRLAGKVVPPVTKVGAEKVRARPVRRCLVALNMMTDRLFVGADSRKMTVGT